MDTGIEREGMGERARGGRGAGIPVTGLDDGCGEDQLRRKIRFQSDSCNGNGQTNTFFLHAVSEMHPDTNSFPVFPALLLSQMGESFIGPDKRSDPDLRAARRVSMFTQCFCSDGQVRSLIKVSMI